MPRGNADKTDQELLHRLSKFDRSVTINDLVHRLNWSRGRVDGSIARLVEKQAIAVVNISKPKGQRQRFIGIPDKDYWHTFYEDFIVKQRAVIIYDSLGVTKPFTFQKSVVGSRISNKNLDPAISGIINKYLNQISEVVKKREMSSAEFLEKAIQYYLNPENAILAKNLVDVVAEAFSSEKDLAEREAARSFVKRAQSMNQDGDFSHA